MAYKSDLIVKQELKSIGSVGNLTLRVFPADTRDDQIHFIDGGLCFGKRDLMYGSCDACWYLPEKWFDPLSEESSNMRPVIAVEGTLALERGSSGNAQYQRFFHALGAILSGVIGVYYLREGKYRMRDDLPKAALNASEKHGIPYLIVNHLSDIRSLVSAVGNYGESSEQAHAVIERIKDEMRSYWKSAFRTRYKSDIKNYYKNRSIIVTKNGQYIKYAGRNYRNFTESSQRAGHIALGEFYLAKYFLNRRFYYFFPRLTPDEIKQLDEREAKEWKLMRKDKLGKIVTIEDFTGISSEWKSEIRSFKDEPLGGSSAGGKNYSKYYHLMKEFKKDVEEGNIYISEYVRK